MGDIMEETIELYFAKNFGKYMKIPAQVTMDERFGNIREHIALVLRLDPNDIVLMFKSIRLDDNDKVQDIPDLEDGSIVGMFPYGVVGCCVTH